MAITKILARKGRLDVGIRYVLNGDKTDDRILTDTLNCRPSSAAQDMRHTKEQYGKTDGVQYYHIIQSFVPGEITPELALELARTFAREHLAGYEVVIGTHVDKHHIHSHIIFNSVSLDTGQKYHSNAQSYYGQIRKLSDWLCREHGLSVIIQGDDSKSLSYIEWLRQSKGQPTYRSMLMADLDTSIEDANDIGHFYMLMEHKGYERRHGKRLGFRLRGQERFMYPERKAKKYSEDGIRAAIDGNLQAIEAGLKPVITYRIPYKPYKKHPKYKGFLALYVHYLYILGKIQKQQYPPRMTPKLRKEVMRFEQLRAQFQFMREHGIETESQMEAFGEEAEAKLKTLTKQRTILNVQKKKRQPLFQALADEEALSPVKTLYADGLSGMEEEYAKYAEAVHKLDTCGISREALTAQKAELYTKLADLNREIREARKQQKMCQEILSEVPTIQKHIDLTERDEQTEVRKHDIKRR
jgi:hypothetical protein